MASIVRSVLSTDWVKISASSITNGVAVDLTADVVQFAFPVSGVAPVDSDWKAGSWQTTTQDGVYFACLLVGPAAALALPANTYDIWIKLFDSPAVPAALRGQIRIV